MEQVVPATSREDQSRADSHTLNHVAVCQNTYLPAAHGGLRAGEGGLTLKEAAAWGGSVLEPGKVWVGRSNREELLFTDCNPYSPPSLHHLEGERSLE